jgi:hypothetical protein
MAATTHARTHKRTSDAVRADVNMQWRLRCVLLEEKLTDLTAALTRSEAERRELSLDYRHCLDRLWALNARLPRTGRR